MIDLVLTSGSVEQVPRSLTSRSLNNFGITDLLPTRFYKYFHRSNTDTQMTSVRSVRDGDVEQDVDHYGYKRDLRTALPQFLAVSVKNFLLLGYGMTLGFPTILIPAVQNPREGEVLHLGNDEISWISSISFIVVPIGCAMSGAVTSSIGRRRAMQMVNVPFLIAWLLFHYSTTTAHLYGALFLTGLGGGLLEAPVLTYVAEITQPHLRGALSATSSMCIIIGVFTQFLLGIFYWRTVALINISFTILAVVSLCFIPESPHWLVSRQRFDEARKSLQWLRGWKKCNAVDKELADIKELYQNTTTKNGTVSTGEVLETDFKKRLWNKISCYLERSFLIPFFLVSYSFFVGHFSGMTTLQTYAVSIFQSLEAPIDKYYATLILGLLQIVGSATCVLLVHYTGKRLLTFFSTAGAAACCILVAFYDGYNRTYGISHVAAVNASSSNSTSEIEAMQNPYSWVPTTLLMLLALLTHTGIRLLPWILIGEVFSARTRAGGAGLAGAVGYIFGFLTNKMYIGMVDTMHIFGTYGLYGIVCLSGCIIFYFILPETEGKKLNEIEDHFAGINRLTNKVYKSKIKSTLEMEKMKGNVNLSFVMDSSKL